VPKYDLKMENVEPTAIGYGTKKIYRTMFQINRLWTLWSRTPISISCNVALGEPNISNTCKPQVSLKTPVVGRVWGLLWGTRRGLRTQ